MSLRHLYKDLLSLGVYSDITNKYERVYSEDGSLDKYHKIIPKIVKEKNKYTLTCGRETIRLEEYGTSILINNIIIELSNNRIDMYTLNEHIKVVSFHVITIDRICKILLRLVYVYDDIMKMKLHLDKLTTKLTCNNCHSPGVFIVTDQPRSIDEASVILKSCMDCFHVSRVT